MSKYTKINSKSQGQGGFKQVWAAAGVLFLEIYSTILKIGDVLVILTIDSIGKKF